MCTWRSPMSAASQGAFVVISEIPSVDKGTHDLQRSICFCINNNYVKHCCVTISSILNHNPYFFDFHVLSSDITDESKQLLSEVSKPSRITFHEVDIKKFKNLKLNIDHTSIETYFRYLIPIMLPEVDKILYLDVDTIIRGDISELFETDIENYYVAGALDTYIESIAHKRSINFPESDLYVNAGVLLLNLKKLRSDNICNLLFENTQKLQNKIKFQDQDIINLTLRPSIKLLDRKYNYTSHLFQQDEKYLLNNAIIVHYTGNIKPWNTKINSKPATLLYYNALSESPFKTTRLTQAVKLNNTKRLIFSRIKLNNNAREVTVLGIKFKYTKKRTIKQ